MRPQNNVCGAPLDGPWSQRRRCSGERVLATERRNGEIALKGVLRDAWRKRSSKHFIDAPFLFLEHPLHLVVGTKFVPSDRIACLSIPLTERGVGGKATAIGFSGPLRAETRSCGPGLRFHLSLMCCQSWFSFSLLAVKYE